jgi:hypothetical protein
MVNEANPNRAKNPRVRTWGGSADRPVVATAPKPYAPSAGMNTQQNIRAGEAYASSIPFVSGAKQRADAEAEATRIANEVLGGQSYGGTGTRTTAFQNALGMLGGGGGGGGGTAGPKASDRLARDEFKYKKEQDAEAKAVRDRALQGMIDQISTNSYRGNIDDLISQISDMETTGKTNVGNIYSDAIENIGSGYTTAQGLMDTGYGALQAYLQQNQNNPYAGLSIENTAVTNPMENYLQAYGAMSPDIANQMQAEQFAGQQGAGAFQNLINVLSANARQNDLSRLAEAQMARTMGTTGLGAQRASFESQAARAQQEALADLSQRIAQAKFEQEQAAGGRKQSIIDAIIAAGGTPPSGQVDTAQNLPDFSGIDFSALNNMFNTGR